ncbi:MAG: hypothetical protein WCF17_05280, partial [Terracidiphilus sp.]
APTRRTFLCCAKEGPTNIECWFSLNVKDEAHFPFTLTMLRWQFRASPAGRVLPAWFDRDAS